MSCETNNTTACRGGRSGYVIIIVLYILLAIILGSAIC